MKSIYRKETSAWLRKVCKHAMQCLDTEQNVRVCMVCGKEMEAVKV